LKPVRGLKVLATFEGASMEVKFVYNKIIEAQMGSSVVEWDILVVETHQYHL
jgi:hypothetical protein